MPPRIVRHNPVELHKPPGYHHITVVESGRLAFLAGQCPIDASGALVDGGNIDRQIDRVAANAATALAAVGAKADHVVRSVIYGVSDDSAVLPAAWQRLTLSVVGSASRPQAHCWGSAGSDSRANSSKWTSPRHFECQERGDDVPGRQGHRHMRVTADAVATSVKCCTRSTSSLLPSAANPPVRH